jgi:hypothetical protein
MSILVFVLLYADDTILLAESESDLQNFWNIFEDGNWKSMLKKRKYWFSKHKRSYDYEFKLYGVNIGIGNSYSYFCLLFNYNDNFTIILPSPERNYLSKLKMLFMGNWEIFQFLLISNLNYSILWLNPYCCIHVKFGNVKIWTF